MRMMIKIMIRKIMLIMTAGDTEKKVVVLIFKK